MKVTVPLLLLACTIITLTQCSLLASLKTTNSILVANMSTNTDYWRSVGWQTSRTEPTPIYTGFTSSGILKAAWTDVSGVGHITTFVADSASSDMSLSGQIRGFHVHDDGSYAVLLWVKPALYIAKYDTSNKEVFNTQLETDRCTDFSLGDGRLTYGFLNGYGNQYMAYYKVHGTSDSCWPGSAGHEGDSLSYINDTGVPTQIWCWGAGIGGCSHSMANLISYNANFNLSAPLCVTDCFPGTSDESHPIGGIYVDGLMIHSAIGGCDGTYGGELGGIEVTATGWLLTINVPNANITNGQGGLNGDNYDVGLATINQTNGAYEVSSRVWLTSTPQNEIYSSVASYGNDYLVGFVREETVNASVGLEKRYHIGLIDSQGTWLGAIEDITTTAGWGERNGFLKAPNGDVVWVYPYTYVPGAAGVYSTPTNQVTVFRLSAGGTSSPASRVESFLNYIF